MRCKDKPEMINGKKNDSVRCYLCTTADINGLFTMEGSTAILPAVAAAIFNEKGEVLLQKRKDVDQWCIISGHVEFGETVEEAILREIKEETDAGADIKRFIGIYSSPASQTYTYSDRKVQYITSYFEAVLKEDIARDFSNNETQELQFFAVENIPQDMALINPHWLSDALNNTSQVFIR
ncbi:NUDIX domain-containing protein [Ferruginibacter sp.]